MSINYDINHMHIVHCLILMFYDAGTLTTITANSLYIFQLIYI